jgi:hypothetical protein
MWLECNTLRGDAWRNQVDFPALADARGSEKAQSGTEQGGESDAALAVAGENQGPGIWLPGGREAVAISFRNGCRFSCREILNPDLTCPTARQREGEPLSIGRDSGLGMVAGTLGELILVELIMGPCENLRTAGWSGGVRDFPARRKPRYVVYWRWTVDSSQRAAAIYDDAALRDKRE